MNRLGFIDDDGTRMTHKHIDYDRDVNKHLPLILSLYHNSHNRHGFEWNLAGSVSVV